MFCCPHCSRLLTILNNVIEPESGVTMLKNVVENCEQCGQQNIFQSCSHQPSQVVHFLLCTSRQQQVSDNMQAVIFCKYVLKYSLIRT